MKDIGNSSNFTEDEELFLLRNKQGKHISKAFFIYSWILGLCFLGLLFLSFYLTGFFKIIPSIILLIWILLFYIKN